MCTSNKYNVVVGEYARKHYIKSFSKKYKWAWDKTFETIENMLSRIVTYNRTSKVNKIHIWEKQYIAKCEFNIEWHSISTKASWNSIIIYVDENSNEVKILLLYWKTDVKWSNETSWWEQEIKNNYKEISKLFSWLK